MELRSCSNLHYVRAIKGGTIKKVPNVTRGRPTLSFKNLSDVYDGCKSNNNEAKFERSCQDAVEEITMKAEPETSACRDASADDKRSFDLDDNCLGNMTLKQIKEICKTRKRTRSQGFESSKVKIKIVTSSCLGDCGEKQISTDDSEFMETLSSWKSKVSKNMKAKRRRRKDTASTYTQAIIPVVQYEEIRNILEFPSTSGNLSLMVEVKSEAPETDCLDDLMNNKFSNGFLANHGLENSFDIVAKEEPETASEFILQNELDHDWECHADLVPLQIVWDSSEDAVVRDSELNTDRSLNLPAIEFESDECDIHPDMHCISPQVISLIEDHHSDIYYDQPDGDAPDTLPNVATCEKFHCMDQDNRSDITLCDDNNEEEFTSDAEIQAKTSSSITITSNLGEYLVCNSDDALSNICNITLCDDTSKDEFTSDAEIQAKTSSSDAFGSNHGEYLVCNSDDAQGNRGNITLCDDNRKDEFASDAEIQAKISSSIAFNSNHGEYLVCNSDEAQGDIGNATLCDGNSKGDFTSDVEIQAKTSSSIAFSLNHGEYLVCNSDDAQESEEKKSFGFVNGDEMKYVTDVPEEPVSSDEYESNSELKHPRRLLSDDAQESEEKSFGFVNGDEMKYVTDVPDEPVSSDECESNSELKHPRRLLSGRKAISPSSQERLCKAMQTIDLHDIDILKCKGKLAFSEQIDEKNGTAEGVPNPSKINMKPPSFKRGSEPKGILKIRHSSHLAPGFSSGCSSIQSSSKSAIAFSTRQMHDMECLAMKLTKELKSMKDMVDDMLRSEFCLNTPLRHKVNEARLAVKNATKAEETAKRCLTVMKRNCNRFCKIMKVAEDGSHTSQDIVRKEKKKIAFADEAGGRLCHVRFYEDESGALLESD